MTVPTISNLPTVPATSDPNFETEAPALFNHIKNTFVSEMNSAISFINSSTFDATVEFKNANFTAARNFLYMIDTSSAAVSVTLPANPSTGDQLLLMDQKRTFGTNNLTIGRNSQNINGAASDVVSKSTGALIRCIFQSSYGWTVDLYEGEWESGTSAGDLVYNGGNVGIGTSAPKGNLDVSGVIEAGTDSSISGSTMLRNRYIGNDYTCNFGTMQSSGAGMIGYAVAPKNGSAGFVSSADVANFARAALEVSYDLKYSTATNQSTTVGDDVTLDTKFIVKNDGRVGIGTSSPGAKLTVNKGNDIGFIVQDNTTDNHRLHMMTSASDNGYYIGYASGQSEGYKLNSSGDSYFLGGNVGIGTNSPDANLAVCQPGSFAAGRGGQINFNGPWSGTATTSFAYIKGYKENGTSGQNGGKLALGTRPNAGNLTERMTIDSSGNVEVSTGNLVIGTAGKGIDFGVASGSVTSQLLDDYEEGTWSPVVADASSGGNTASGSFSGTYTKVGRIVTVHCYALDINTTGLTSTNSIVVRGLPFTNGDTIAKYGSIRLQSVTFSGYCVAQLGGSSSSVSIIENKSGISNSNVTVGALNSGVADILFSLTYQS